MSLSSRARRGIDPEPTLNLSASKTRADTIAPQSNGRGIDPEPACNEIVSAVGMLTTMGDGGDVESPAVTEEEAERESLLQDSRPSQTIHENGLMQHRTLLMFTTFAVLSLFTAFSTFLWRRSSLRLSTVPLLPNTIEAIHARQIESYKAGRALMKNIHVTHHGGTFFCAQMRSWGPTPDFACMYNRLEYNETIQPILDEPWTENGTNIAVPVLLERFRFVSNEYRGTASPHPLHDTNWENEDLVSVYVTKHPIDRALSGDGNINGLYPPENERTSDDWWRFANEHRHTNNYALATLSDLPGCCNGAETNPSALENAKELLTRFTIVIDSACLSESIRELAKLMGIKNATIPDRHSSHPPARERLGNDTLYEYLLARNKLDIQMHEFAKNRSLVDCDALLRNTDEEEELPREGSSTTVDDTEDSGLPQSREQNGNVTSKDDKASVDVAHDVPANIEEVNTKQIENYKAGRALMKAVHVTHHGGTFLCAEMRKWGPAPEFACGVTQFEIDRLEPLKSNETIAKLVTGEPWSRETTDIVIPIIREHFHFVTFEYRGVPTPRPMYDTNWENEDLVSIYITKHPIDRALSGDGMIDYPPLDERTSDDWWRFANEPRHTNNYALASLSDVPGCCNGADTNPIALENAKKLISRFTFVMDSACLSESIRELAKLMGIQNVTIPGRSTTHRPSRERIGNDTLYDYLMERNKLDVQMHEYAQSRSLVDCATLV